MKLAIKAVAIVSLFAVMVAIPVSKSEVNAIPCAPDGYCSWTG